MNPSRFSFGDARPGLGVKEKLSTFGVLFLFFYSCREAASFNRWMQLTTKSVTPFAFAKAAPLSFAADPRC
jgi:hypothetical protein